MMKGHGQGRHGGEDGLRGRGRDGQGAAPYFNRSNMTRCRIPMGTISDAHQKGRARTADGTVWYHSRSEAEQRALNKAEELRLRDEAMLLKIFGCLHKAWTWNWAGAVYCGDCGRRMVPLDLRLDLTGLHVVRPTSAEIDALQQSAAELEARFVPRVMSVVGSMQPDGSFLGVVERTGFVYGEEPGTSADDPPRSGR